jgi:hypothetical protein
LNNCLLQQTKGEKGQILELALRPEKATAEIAFWIEKPKKADN